MKKTDTCYYMSITKEENSAFVVANNQGGIGEATQVIVETKTDATSANNGSATSTPTTNAVTATMNSTGATSVTTTTTTTTTISTSCTGCGDGNGTAINNGANVHQRFSNSCNITLSETLCRQETCTGPRVQDRSNGPQDHRVPLPQVILQVLPSTPIPTQHYNLLASNVHRECRMHLAMLLFLLFQFLFLSLLFRFKKYYIISSSDPFEDVQSSEK